MTIILLKLLASSGILFAYYWLFLRNRKFHRYNRFYLLGAVLVSMVLPFLKIDIFLSPTAPANKVILDTLEVITVNGGEEEVVLADAGNSWMDGFNSTNIMWSVYIIGAIVFLSLLIRSLLYIRKIKRNYPVEKIEDLKFYNTAEPGTPFSFFRNIFWNNKVEFNSSEGQQIFRHELFHVKQQHSADLLFMEIVMLFAWFNPFFYLIKKELKAIHEFLADEYAVSNSDEYAYAELLVLFALHEKQNKLVHPFFHNTIKRRIAMITNLKNKKVGYWGRVMALPLSLLLFSFIAINAQKSEMAGTESNTTTSTNLATHPITIILDAGHGGAAAGAVNATNSITEKEITLELARKIEALASAYNVKTILTRKEDITIKNTERMAFAQSNPHDLLVSIHVNASIPPSSKTIEDSKEKGFEVYISGKNNLQSKAAAYAASNLINALKTIYTTNENIKTREYEGIYILDFANSPAVMVECGYITNDKDLAFITDPANQEMIAKKILEGIVNYSNAINSDKTLQTLVKKQQEEQTNNNTDTIPKKVLEDAVLTLRRPEKKSPTANEWDLWKDEKIYGVWLDGKRITNDVLNNHTPNEFSWYMVSKLARNTVNYGKHYYQVNLYTHDYFKKEFPEETKTINVQRMHAVSDTVKLSPKAFEEKISKNDAEKRKAKLDLKEGQCYLKIENDPYVYTVSMDDLNAYHKNKKGALEDKNEDRDVTFTLAEVDAQFQGGIDAWGKYLRETLIYPKEAIAKNIQGTVLVQFIVDKEGNLSDLKTLSGDPLLCEEALRVVKNSSGKWLPALQNNRKVKIYKKQPIVFILANNNSDSKTKDPAFNERQKGISEVIALARVEGKAAYHYKGRYYIFAEIDPAAGPKTNTYYEADEDKLSVMYLNGKRIQSIDEINQHYARKDIKKINFLFTEQSKAKYNSDKTVLEIETY